VDLKIQKKQKHPELPSKIQIFHYAEPNLSLFLRNAFPMHCILSENDDPYFNLAAEEYLLHDRTEDFFLLWKSKPAVIAGKHQNTLAEISPRFVHDHDILVARRLSGGGTVYHDRGSLNFTFITNEKPGRLIDFARYSSPVIRFLEKNGLEATFGSKNEILAGGYKISGNAGHVYKNRVLHHGTLLFDTNLEYLRSALSANTGRYSSRAVQSNRARVANIADLLAHPVSMEEFSRRLFDFIRKRYSGKMDSLSHEETGRIGQLAIRKYSEWEWIYGYSPEYQFKNEFSLEGSAIKISFTGQKGVISGFEMHGDGFPPATGSAVAERLNGCRHTWSGLLTVVQQLKLPGIATEKTAGVLMPNLF
jgi:lipoate-protein ligase A